MEVALIALASGNSSAQGGPVSVRIPIEDGSRVGEARRAADAIAAREDLSEEERSTVGVIVTELSSNLAKHAKGGEILLRRLSTTGRSGVEILGVDRGPGIGDVRQASADGFSTRGTSGNGIGAMQRMSDEFAIHSIAGTGSVFLARVFASASVRSPQLLNVGVVCTPIAGEAVSGDGWAIVQNRDRAIILIVDALGHGPDAAVAADRACEVFQEVAERRPGECVNALHEALRDTRGAALMVAEIVRAADGANVTVAGAGNVTAAILAPSGRKALLSVNGTAGLAIRGLREFTGSWMPSARLVLASDGITTRWSLSDYPDVYGCDPAIAAALLHRDHNRHRDDSTVMVVSLASLE